MRLHKFDNQAAKLAISQAYVSLGGRMEFGGQGKPGDNPQIPDYVRCLRAAAVKMRGGRPTNLSRKLRGGFTIDDVLAKAGI